MRINSNINSILIRNDLNGHSLVLDNAAQRLASGRRINSAADDAAGLAISERMRSDIRGTAQGIRNATDGMSLIQTTEGALSNVVNMLQRSRELVLQAANGVNSAGNKAVIQQEVDQISQGISNILSTTRFNGQSVFSYGIDPADLTGIAELEYWLSTSWIPESSKLIEDSFGLNARGQSIELTYDSDGAGGVAAYVAWTGFDAVYGGSTSLKLAIDLEDFELAGYPSGNAGGIKQDRIIAHEVVHAVMASNMDMANLPGWFTEGAAEFIHGADLRVSNDLAAVGSGNLMVSANLKTTPGSPTGATASLGYSAGYVATRMLDAASTGGIKAIMLSLKGGLSFSAAITANTSFANQAAFETDVLAQGQNYIDSTMNITDTDTGSVHGSDYAGVVKSNEDVISNLPIVGSATDLQLTGLSIDSSTSGEADITIKLGNDSLLLNRILIDKEAISVSTLEVTDTEAALGLVDAAIAKVSEHQGTLGAYSNRLNHVVNSLSVFSEQTSAARSRIVDADYARESSALTRVQVLMQAAQAMLAQSNARPAQVMQLLR